MTLTAGSRLGPYEILSLLGIGGMGEVYKARDTRLDRTVAIKILQSADPHQQQRFDREARAISALDHPHICALYDVQQESGQQFLVMQYVDGETLADRLGRGALPLEQALRYAIEIADALAHAHRYVIVHRDLKPANIMLTKSGVKLLDFGLAKLQETAAQPVAASLALTKSPGLTAEGTILGTLHYMAPEQLEGKEADARSDLFAFGVIVHEMVTGKRAFEGSNPASVIAAILDKEPAPMSTLQPLAPLALERAVKTCLAKDPEQRWQSAADLARELRGMGESIAQQSVATAAAPWRNLRGVLMVGIICALAGGVIGAFAVRIGGRASTAAPPLSATRSTISAKVPLFQDYGSLALSPDGRRLAYIGVRDDDTTILYLQSLDEFEAKPIAGTDDASYPFFSPDGRSLAFFADGKLKKLATSGGAPQIFCDALAGYGGAWGSDDTIVFSRATSGLFRVSANGGTPQVLTTPDRAKHEKSHRFPHFLPDGKAVLFTIVPTDVLSFDEALIGVVSLATGRVEVVLAGGTDPRFVPTGHLLFARGGALFAASFDAERLKVTSQPAAVVDTVSADLEYGSVQASVADTGLLAYLRGEAVGHDRRVLWVDRQGRGEPLMDDRKAFGEFSLSPDGQRLAVTIAGANDQAWTYDIARRTLTRATFDWDNFVQAWTRDGKQIVVRSDRAGAGIFGLYAQNADGSGLSQRLIPESAEYKDVNLYNQSGGSWSPDGSNFVFAAGSSPFPGTGSHIWLLTLRPERRARVLIHTSFNEAEPMLSPDSRWLAYSSDDSGRWQVYVQPFPDLGGKWQISDSGGTAPVWEPHGRELLYLNGNKVMAVAVETQPTFKAGNPRLLFEGPYLAAYDVAPDGRFIVIERGRSEAPVRQIALVLNWFEELKRRVATR